jgi:hypothetical protein
MFDYAYWKQLLDREHFRDDLENGLKRLEEAFALIQAGRGAGPQSALERVATIWEEPDPSRVVDWLYRRSFSSEEEHVLLTSLRRIQHQMDTLPRRQRLLADRTLYRLLHKLPLELSRELVVHCIQSRRKLCRAAGYRALMVHGIPQDLAALVWSRYGETGDEEPLKLLACAPNVLGGLDVHELLRCLPEKYYRIRLIESLLIIHDTRIDQLALAYPIEFAWAAGRTADIALVPTLRALLSANKHEPEFVWSCMWAFSKMPDVEIEDVEQVQQIVVELVKQKPTFDELLALRDQHSHSGDEI